MLLAGALLLWGLGGPIQREHLVDSVINECWKGRDHAGMSQCVASRAKEAQAARSRAEKAAANSIRTSSDEPGFPNYRRDALSRLYRASGAFSKYVKTECDYEATLATKGNASEDLRQACIVVLDEQRVQIVSETYPTP